MSNIDPTKPIYGTPTTQSVRDNFQHAHDEIDAINASLAGYLPLAGGTMSGPLTLSGAPTLNLHAATKAYADTMLPLAGGTMTGLVTLSGDPITNLQAASKRYVDQKPSRNLIHNPQFNVQQRGLGPGRPVSTRRTAG